MNKYLLRNRSLWIFSEGMGSTWSAVLNIALFISILISLFTPYTYFGILLCFIIGAAEILFIVSVYWVLRSTSIRYKVIDAVLEWKINSFDPETITSQKKYTIRLMQSTKSICYYLEPTEKIVETPNLLAVYSEKRCEEKNYGYTPVELYFSSYYPNGAEIQIEIVTETKKANRSKSGTISFHTHNKPARLNLYLSISQNGRDHQLKTKLQYRKGTRKGLVTSNTVIFKRRELSPKLIWKSDKIVDNAIYDIQWEYD